MGWVREGGRFGIMPSVFLCNSKDISDVTCCYRELLAAERKSSFVLSPGNLNNKNSVCKQISIFINLWQVNLWAKQPVTPRFVLSERVVFWYFLQTDCTCGNNFGVMPSFLCKTYLQGIMVVEFKSRQ